MTPCQRGGRSRWTRRPAPVVRAEVSHTRWCWSTLPPLNLPPSPSSLPFLSPPPLSPLPRDGTARGARGPRSYERVARGACIAARRRAHAGPESGLLNPRTRQSSPVVAAPSAHPRRQRRPTVIVNDRFITSPTDALVARSAARRRAAGIASSRGPARQTTTSARRGRSARARKSARAW